MLWGSGAARLRVKAPASSGLRSGGARAVICLEEIKLRRQETQDKVMLTVLNGRLSISESF